MMHMLKLSSNTTMVWFPVQYSPTANQISSSFSGLLLGLRNSSSVYISILYKLVSAAFFTFVYFDDDVRSLSIMQSLSYMFYTHSLADYPHFVSLTTHW